MIIMIVFQKCIVQYCLIITMFLSKKNAFFLNKPNKNKKIQLRILPGWGDDEEAEDQNRFKTQYKNSSIPRKNTGNLLGEQQTQVSENIGQLNTKNSKENAMKRSYYNWDELNEMTNIQYEKKLVEAIVQPVGVKIKPTENQLVQFAKQSKSIEPSIIGSLLLSKIEVNYPFVVKAKSLYTIQYLIKKNTTFLNYFKSQSSLLQQFPEPEDNVENYRKILKNVLNAIGVLIQKNSQTADNQAITFVDPGYNNGILEGQAFSKSDKQRKPIGPNAKKFISPNQAKKINGEAQKKNDPFDIFSTETEQNQNKKKQNFDELILIGNPPQSNQSNNNNIKFDDLLKGGQNPTGFNFTL